MKNYFTAFVILCILMSWTYLSGYAQENPRDAPHAEMLDDATMERLVKLGEVSNQHRLLSSLVGTWYCTLQYWDKDGAVPQTSSGAMTNEMILGGRFLSSKTNLILNIGGQNIPYEGWGIIGYDAIKNAYVSVWADTMRAGMLVGTAQYNEKRKTLEEKVRFTNPLIGKEQSYRSEIQFVNDNAYKEILFISNKFGKEFKAIEINFSKAE